MSRKRIEVLKLQAVLDGAALGNILKSPKKQARVEFTCFCGEKYSKQVGDVVGGNKLDYSVKRIHWKEYEGKRYLI